MKTTLLLACVLSIANSAFAQVSIEAASKMTQQINAMLSDYTDTLVTPTSGTEGVIIISQKALQTQKVTRLWMMISACAIGKHLNDRSDLSLDEIWFADVNDLKARPARFYVLPASVAKSVQARVYAGTLELEDAQGIIASKLTKRTKEIQ